MSFFDSPEYDYSYDKSVSSPLGSLLNSEGEVRRIKENVRPLHGFAPVNKALNRTNNTRKFIYTMRHGKALHNAMSKEYTKPISWRFFPKLVDNFDPSLTPEGFRDAQHAGQLLRELIQEEDAPIPVIVYTSPLRRCIQTAMYAISALRLDQKITLCVKEGLREWKGYDHDHQSDRRNTTPHILSLFNDLKRKLRVNVEIELDGKQDAEDDLIMRETYVDVDRRTREVLDDIFNDDDSTCSMLVLHNRSNKSVMRVMGHIQDEVHKLDKENCAMLGYLMERTLLHPAAAQRRFEIEEENWHSDKMMALEEKQDRYEQAAEDIDDYRRNNVPKLLNLRDYLGLRTLQGDEEALKALVDLYQLAPELKLMARQAVKLGDQAT
ncbi:putative phosphoglycerate mutase pmu1 [Gnomoniopsis smithogilvyi]|uniref:Phosphoglycerate mutase pmu1 n=1 Tax=Gnomoniopsis smithogilvyi TaxID=1191159 RepID=A0A9W8YUL7_9PEZI|nr:putative phosphoglycerate mutase pmu1 [Gnomoniopsis smithogilvyi]